jgi:hypothetical protein
LVSSSILLGDERPVAMSWACQPDAITGTGYAGLNVGHTEELVVLLANAPPVHRAVMKGEQNHIRLFGSFMVEELSTNYILKSATELLPS